MPKEATPSSAERFGDNPIGEVRRATPAELALAASREAERKAREDRAQAIREQIAKLES